jgi:hypothetical protein
VINRHELGLQLEVFDGIAAVGHHVCGQIIRLHNGDLRTIDEPALKFIPFREPSEGPEGELIRTHRASSRP